MCTGPMQVGAERLPDVEIRLHNGRPTVFIDGTANALTTYSNFGQKNLEDAMAFFAAINMDVYHISVARIPGDYDSNRFWEGDTIDSQPVREVPDDFYGLDEQAAFILENDPDAWLIVRLVTRPPASWKDLHPQEYFITDEGTVHDTPSLASEAFWGAAAEFSAAVVRYSESASWRSRVIAYANYHHTEGCHMPVGDGWLFDHSPPMRKAYRDFLQGKYGSVEKLQSAYGDSQLTFDSIQVPTDRLRGPVPEVKQIPYWQAGPDNQALVDYLELTRDLFHKRFRQLGGKMEAAADRRMIFLHDALKQTMLGWNLKGFFGYPSFGESVSWSPAYPEFMAGSGSINVAALQDAPGYDGLITPHDYQARGIGGVYEPEGIVDSIVLRGMYFSSEMDSRFSNQYGIGAARNDQETAAILWRNLATGLTRGFNSYWQWGFYVQDWFYSENTRDLISLQADIMRESLDWQHETMPGIAMILDDSAVFETNGSGNFFNEAILWEQKMGMARCGVPHRIYLLEDLELDNFPKHRVFYFPNLFRVDEKRMALLQEKVFRDGNIVVWGPGSGISDGDKIGTESASKLTGFEFTMLPANAQRRILVSNFDHPITRNLGADMVIGGPLPYGPVLIPADGVELGLAWAKGGMNLIGMSYKEFGKGAAGDRSGITARGRGDYGALFLTAVQIPADLWRNIARYAGAHVYCESNDILLADNSVVALHSLKPEKKTIFLPGESRVKDLVTGKLISKGTRRITFNHEAPDTHVFLLEEP
ncbi:MAG: hypothetical protein O2782_18680 [bacterium]|nr:hypothetical protein [bacterium]